MNENICQNCQAELNKEFCGNCGEKHFETDNVSIFSLFKHILISITDVDGKFFTSLKLLAIKPGQLTLDYLNGIRKYRLYPFQLFIFINILYFFVVSITHQDTFVTPLKVHLSAENFFHNKIAKNMVDDRLKTSGETFKEFEAKFNNKIESQSKILIFIMIPILSLLMSLMFFRINHIGIKSLIYATHLFSFLLLLLSIIIVVFYLLSYLWLLLFDSYGHQYFSNDAVYSVIVLSLLLIYLFLSAKRVFAGNLWWLSLKALLLTFAIYWSLLIYRSILFFTSFYSVSI